MKRRKEGKEKWEDFEARVGMKRSGAGEGKKGASAKAVPNDILVQRMSSTASGRLKKFEPLDTRDFVPFGDYDDLTMENIKEACEKYYQAPEGSCDILASDRGPSCTKLEQIKGKKVYFIRFLPPKSTDVAPKLGQQLFEDSLAPAKVTMSVPSPVIIHLGKQDRVPVLSAWDDNAGPFDEINFFFCFVISVVFKNIFFLFSNVLSF